MAEAGDAAAAEISVQQLADGSNAVVGRRSNEMKKIEALKLRLKNLRAEHSLAGEANVEEVEALKGKCENLLNLTRRIADGIHNKLQAEREEMERYRDAAVLLLSDEDTSPVPSTAGASGSVEKEEIEKRNSKRASLSDSGAVVAQQKERIAQLEEELNEREADVEALKKKNQEVTTSLKEIAEEAAENAELLVNLQMAELTRISSEEYNTAEDLKLALEKERLTVAAERKKMAELTAELQRMKALVADAEARTAVAQEAASEAAAAVASSAAITKENSGEENSQGSATNVADGSEGSSNLSAVGEGGLLQLAQTGSSSSLGSVSDADEVPEVRIARHYLNKLKLLEATFETDELLAKALYKDLGAEAIEKPQRVGFLTKQGGAVKSWKRRYFVLKDNFLFYYKRVKDDTPIGVIQLEAGCAEEAAPGEIDKKNCFKLKTKSRVWWLHAERQIEMDIWIECVKNLTSWYDNASLRQPVVMQLRRSTNALSQPSAPVRAAKKASKSFRISTYLATPSPK